MGTPALLYLTFRSSSISYVFNHSFIHPSIRLYVTLSLIIQLPGTAYREPDSMIGAHRSLIHTIPILENIRKIVSNSEVSERNVYESRVAGLKQDDSYSSRVS